VYKPLEITQSGQAPFQATETAPANQEEPHDHDDEVIEDEPKPTDDECVVMSLLPFLPASVLLKNICMHLFPSPEQRKAWTRLKSSLLTF
jgi:hypothetical protein